MTAGVELPFVDVEAWTREQAEVERALLDVATRNGEDNDGKDYFAATELLFKYADDDTFFAPEVRRTIERGARHIAHMILEQQGPGRRAEISPLMYFGKEGAQGRKSHQYNNDRLKQRIALGMHLTPDDARIALTMEYEQKGKHRTRSPDKLERVAKEDWPETVEDVEIALVDYVRNRLFKGADEEAARAYVRESFPTIPWGKRDVPVTYPDAWSA